MQFGVGEEGLGFGQAAGQEAVFRGTVQDLAAGAAQVSWRAMKPSCEMGDRQGLRVMGIEQLEESKKEAGFAIARLLEFFEQRFPTRPPRTVERFFCMACMNVAFDLWVVIRAKLNFTCGDSKKFSPISVP